MVQAKQLYLLDEYQKCAVFRQCLRVNCHANIVASTLLLV